MTKDKGAEQSIEQLQKRYQTLHQKQIEANRDLQNAMERLEELKKEAREAYGTDDVEELKNKLERMREENERKRAEYQKTLDGIERELSDVEKKFADEEADGGGEAT